MCTRKFLVVLLATVAGLITGWIAMEGTDTSPQLLHPSHPIPEASATSSPVLQGRADVGSTDGIPYQAGNTLFYQFSSDEAVSVRLPTIQAGTQGHEIPPVDTRFHLEGHLALTVHADAGRDYVLGIRIDGLHADVTTEGFASAPERHQVAEMSNLEALAQVSSSGEFGKIVFPKSASDGARRAIRGVLSRFQTILPKGVARGRCERRERDVRGVFVASYERLSPAGDSPLVFIKRKLRYEKADAAQAQAGEEFLEIAGEIRYELDPLPVLIEGFERLRSKIDESGVTQEQESRFRFVRIARKKTDPNRGVATSFEQNAGEALVAAATPRETLGTEAAREKMQETLAALRSELTDGNARRVSAQRLVFDVVHILREYPGTAEDVMSTLTEGSTTGQEAALLSACLAVSGTRPSQEVLMQLLKADSRDGLLRRIALASLLQVEKPIPELDVALLRLHEQRTARAGLMVLATIGDRIRESDPKRFDAIRSRVLAEAREAGNGDQLALALRSLSNIRHDEVPQVVKTSRDHRSVRVRVAALEALVRVESADADEDLRDVLRNGREGVERLMALRVLARRHQEGHDSSNGTTELLLNALDKAGSTDESEMVRKAAKSLADSLRKAG